MYKVFYTSPQENFIEAVAAYLVAVASGKSKRTHNNITTEDPLALARYTIYLPNRRACLKLTQALQRVQGSFALPKMYGLNDSATLSLDHCFWNDPVLKKPVISPLKQKHLVIRFIMQARPELAISQILPLAKDLLRVIEELQRDDIHTLPREIFLHSPFSDIYKNNLTLLSMIIDHVPRILNEWGVITSLSYKKRVFELLPEYWKNTQDQHFIIAGISQYQKDSMRLLSKAISLHNTSVILPFVAMDEIEKTQPPTSPHYSTQKIIQSLGSHDITLSILSSCFSPNKSENNFCLKEKSDVKKQEIYSLTHSTPLEEARAIASYIDRNVLDCNLVSEENQASRVVIVAPDRTFVTRLRKEMSDRQITINDSSASSFYQIPEGVCALLAAKVMAFQDVKDYVQFLKHPFVFPSNRGVHLKEIYDFEVKLRSKPFLSTSLKSYDYPYKSLIEPLLLGNSTQENHQSYSHTQKLLEILKIFTEDFLESPEGILLGEYCAEFDAREIFSNTLSSSNWFHLFEDGLKDLTIPQDPPVSGSDVNVIGLMEARVENADLMIITGLEEGMLPRSIPYDPWLDPHLRRILGLSTPEELIGLQAQDFMMSLTGARKIILSRHYQNNDNVKQASRFWHRVDHTPLDYDDYNSGEGSLSQVQLPSLSKDYLQPPCPANDLKPKKLSISGLKILMEDPYGFYAKYILGVKRLWAFDDDSSALVFGQYLHHALDAYIKKNCRFESQEATTLIHFTLKYFKDNPLTLMQKKRIEGFCTWLCEHTNIARNSSFSMQTEVLLEKSLSINEDRVTLYGTADRIDRVPNDTDSSMDGRILTHVIDYKTGAPPSQKNIEKGYAPQLPLEAWLLGADPQNLVLSHIHILSKAPFADLKSVKNVEALLSMLEERIENILKQYLDRDFYFYPVPNPYNQPTHSDYSHLERLVV